MEERSHHAAEKLRAAESEVERLVKALRAAEAAEYENNNNNNNNSSSDGVLNRGSGHRRNGHHGEECAALRRFEGTCGACGQYGHMWRNCAMHLHGSSGEDDGRIVRGGCWMGVNGGGSCIDIGGSGGGSPVAQQQVVVDNEHRSDFVDLVHVGGEVVAESEYRSAFVDLVHVGILRLCPFS